MWGLAAVGGAAEELALAAYLDQVRAESPDYRALEEAAAAAALQKAQADWVYVPTLGATAQHGDNRQEQTVAAIFGTQTTTDDATIGVSKKWAGGFQTAVEYGWNRTDIAGSEYVTAPYYQVYPKATLYVPLWRDARGAGTRAGADKLRRQYEAAAKTAHFQRDGILYAATVAYWQLALARAETAIREDLVRRHDAYVAWAQRRVERHLADTSEVVQARAALKVRELEQRQATESEQDAGLAFNRWRGRDAARVAEALLTLDADRETDVPEPPETPPARWDLAAARLEADRQKAAWREAADGIKPDVEAFASAAASGLDDASGGANAEAGQWDYPTYVVGVTLSVPLDRDLMRRGVRGYRRGYESARLSVQAKEVEVAQEWRALRRQWADVRRRLVLRAEIERLQREKAALEQARWQDGRATQFQVLAYENDYALARLDRLATALERELVAARIAWYSDASETEAPE